MRVLYGWKCRGNKVGPKERERETQRVTVHENYVGLSLYFFVRLYWKCLILAQIFLPTKNWQPTNVCKGCLLRTRSYMFHPFHCSSWRLIHLEKWIIQDGKKMKEEEMFGSLECACFNLPIYKYKTILFAVLPSIWSIWKIESLKMKEENMIGSVHLNLLAWTRYTKVITKIAHLFTLFVVLPRGSVRLEKWIIQNENKGGNFFFVWKWRGLGGKNFWAQFQISLLTFLLSHTKGCFYKVQSFKIVFGVSYFFEDWATVWKW
jgi:hypothetical protein